jgi:hypothetical protein
MSTPVEPLLLLLGPPLGRSGPHAPALPLGSARQAQLLLALALRPTRGWTRPELAARLWPDLDAEAAGRNLRKVLHRLKADGGEGWVRADGQRLVLAVSTDLQAFDARWQSGDAPGALALVRGTLGEGVPPWPDDDELAAERQHWLGRWRSALARALPQLLPEVARDAVQRWLEHEPGDDALRRALDDRPPPATAAARTATIAPAAHPSPAAAALLGREGEQEDLALRLAAAGSVVGLLGPGGIGKSTLARAAAQSWRGRVVWVACQGLPDGAALTLALLHALGEAPVTGVDPDRQAGAALAPGTVLLVLDALEDAAADRGLATRLAAWRRTATELRVLWTARRQPDEWPGGVIALGGLDVPDVADPGAAVLRAPAVRLLALEAQRSWPGFDGVAQAAALGRIARAVGGHPQALVIAAGWLGLLPASAVADDVEDGHALLARPATGLVAEGSLAAMLDRSLALLGGEAGDALARLAVFRDGFDASGALAVAGVGLAALHEFVRHGLVRAEDGRFHLHALVARHAWQRLGRTQRDAAHQAHARALAADAAGQARRHGAASAEALRWARQHAADLQDAWATLVRLGPDARDGDDPAEADAAALAEAWVRHHEGGPGAPGVLADLAAALQRRPAVAAARVRALRARLQARCGEPEAARATADAVRRDPGADPRSVALASLAIAQAVQLTGDWAGLAAALDTAAGAVASAGLDDLQGELEVARLSLLLQTGPLTQAEVQGRRAVAATRRLDGAPLVMALIGLGFARRRLRRHAEAFATTREALQVADRHGLAGLRLRALGELACLHGDTDEFEECERLGLVIVHQATLLGDRNQQRAGWLMAGAAADLHGRPVDGLQRLCRALALALEIGATSAALAVVSHASDACAHLGDAVLARRLMALVDHHPSTWGMHHDGAAPAEPDPADLPLPDLAEVPGLLAEVLARHGTAAP